jgi:hypothetical protein
VRRQLLPDPPAAVSQPSAPLLVPSPLTRSTLLNRPVGGCPKSYDFRRSQARE